MANMSDIVAELRTGFQMMSRDIKDMSSKAYGSGLASVNLAHETVSNANRTAVEASRMATRAPSTFFSKTFSDKFNDTALWSRDIIASGGGLWDKEYRDVTQRAARYYARQHWKQRSPYLLNTAAGIAAWGGGPVTGFAYDLLVSPLIEKHIARKQDLWNNLDRTGKTNILAGMSTNAITNTGWNDKQLDILTKFMMTSHRGTGFKRDEADEIYSIANQQGYFKGVGEIDKFKRSYKELLSGVKEIMQVMHTSRDEAIKVMSDISTMKLGDSPSFIKNLNVAAAHSGLSPTQLTAWAGQSAKTMYNAYGISPDVGGKIALNMTHDPGTSGVKQRGLSELMTNPIYLASFSTYKDGKLNLDDDKINEFMSGKTTINELSEYASDYFKGGDATAKLMALKTGAPGLIAELGADRMGAMAPMFDLIKATSIVDQMYPEHSPERTNAIRYALSDMGLSQKDVDASMKIYDNPASGINYAKSKERYLKKETPALLTRWWNAAKDFVVGDPQENSILGQRRDLGEHPIDQLVEGALLSLYLAEGGNPEIKKEIQEEMAEWRKEDQDRKDLKDTYKINKDTIKEMERSGYIAGPTISLPTIQSELYPAHEQQVQQAKILERYTNREYEKGEGNILPEDEVGETQFIINLRKAKATGEWYDRSKALLDLGYFIGDDVKVTDQDFRDIDATINEYANIFGVLIDDTSVDIASVGTDDLVNKWTTRLDNVAKKSSRTIETLLATEKGKNLYTQMAIAYNKDGSKDSLKDKFIKDFGDIIGIDLSTQDTRATQNVIMDDVVKALDIHHDISGAEEYLTYEKDKKKYMATETSGIYTAEAEGITTILNNLIIAGEELKNTVHDLHNKVKEGG